jgi:hypothetical protein
MAASSTAVLLAQRLGVPAEHVERKESASEPDAPAASAARPPGSPAATTTDAGAEKPSQAAGIAAALAAGGAAERERAYAAVEGVVRGAAFSGGGKGQATALAVACVEPLIVSVLCAPASRVGEAEWVRASLLLYEMCKVNLVAVSAELFRKTAAGGGPLFFTVWAAPGTALAAVVAKAPGEWGRADAIRSSPPRTTASRCRHWRRAGAP